MMDKVSSECVDAPAIEFPYEFKVVIIGSAAVGKTAITNRLQYQQFKSDYTPTIGAGYFPYRALWKNRWVELQIWDTAGMERYKSLAPIYYRNSSAAIIVYDQTNKKSAEDVAVWLDDFRENVKTPTAIMLIGNKDDLQEKTVSDGEMKAWAAQRGIDFIKTSAKTGKGITEMAAALIRKLYSMNVDDADPRPEIVKEDPPEKKYSCC